MIKNLSIYATIPIVLFSINCDRINHKNLDYSDARVRALSSSNLVSKEYGAQYATDKFNKNVLYIFISDNLDFQSGKQYLKQPLNSSGQVNSSNTSTREKVEYQLLPSPEKIDYWNHPEFVDLAASFLSSKGFSILKIYRGKELCLELKIENNKFIKV